MLNEVFEYRNYRELMRSQLEARPNEGYGELSRAAKYMSVAPSLLSSVLKGDKHLTPEQALAWARWSEMTELEGEYFFVLVQFERAGTEDLRRYLDTKLRELRARSQVLKERLPPRAELPETAKAIFYSDWSYSAVRIASSLEHVHTEEDLARELGISRAQVVRVLEFLLRHQLVVETKAGLQVGSQSTHVGANEPIVARHHTNWRLKALEKISKDPTSGLYFTSPVSVSREDVQKIRRVLMSSLDSVFDIVDPSKPERVACLNLDWFVLGEDD